MAKSRFEYVKEFEQSDELLKNCWIVVRIDGRGFTKFTEEHQFEKPNDERALRLMNHAAAEVMKDCADMVLSYGQSDEYSFVLKRDADLYKRRASKISTYVASLFTAHYVFSWADFFPDKKLQRPPSFDGRCICYPTDENVKDYLRWRYVDCHINNLYNTCFWKLVLEKKYSKQQAQTELAKTNSEQKNELLYNDFNMNYNDCKEIFKKGSTQIWVHRADASSTVLTGPARAGKAKRTLEVMYVDLCKEQFWGDYPGIIPTAKRRPAAAAGAKQKRQPQAGLAAPSVSSFPPSRSPPVSGPPSPRPDHNNNVAVNAAFKVDPPPDPLPLSDSEEDNSSIYKTWEAHEVRASPSSQPLLAQPYPPYPTLDSQNGYNVFLPNQIRNSPSFPAGDVAGEPNSYANFGADALEPPKPSPLLSRFHSSPQPAMHRQAAAAAGNYHPVSSNAFKSLPEHHPPMQHAETVPPVSYTAFPSHPAGHIAPSSTPNSARSHSPRSALQQNSNGAGRARGSSHAHQGNGRRSPNRQPSRDIQVEEKSFFFPRFDRDQSEELLNRHPVGTYLLRKCTDRKEFINGTQNPDLFVLQYRNTDRISNVKIYRYPQLGLGQKRDRNTCTMHETIDDLVRSIIRVATPRPVPPSAAAVAHSSSSSSSSSSFSSAPHSSSSSRPAFLRPAVDSRADSVEDEDDNPG